MISVIIPVYNTERFLEECIQSILEQTYQDLEIILVDDGSTDQSAAICDHYSEEYANIHTIHNSNQGPAYSRRQGLVVAKGELIMFLDADDWVAPETVQTLEEKLYRMNADVIACEFVDVYSNKKKVPRIIYSEELIECRSYMDCIHEIHGTRRLLTGLVAKLYKKELFYNIDFNEHITIGEDYSMLLQVLRKAEKVIILNKQFYYRRMHGNNISRSGYTDRHKDALDNYLIIRRELISEFPLLYIEILGYHIEYEMAVITAMCRNNVYDKAVILKLKNDLQNNMQDILQKCNIPIYMKICAFTIAMSPALFCIIFKFIRVFTGR